MSDIQKTIDYFNSEKESLTAFLGIQPDPNNRLEKGINELFKNQLTHYQTALAAIQELEQYRFIGTIKQKIINDVIAERNRQDKKWGEQNHFPPQWATIIGEEYGEMCKAINEFGFNPTSEIEQDIYIEAIQTMASCMAMLEHMGRIKAVTNNMEKAE